MGQRYKKNVIQTTEERKNLGNIHSYINVDVFEILPLFGRLNDNQISISDQYQQAGVAPISYSKVPPLAMSSNSIHALLYGWPLSLMLWMYLFSGELL